MPPDNYKGLHRSGWSPTNMDAQTMHHLSLGGNSPRVSGLTTFQRGSSSSNKRSSVLSSKAP
jgi:hypothetical protein